MLVVAMLIVASPALALSLGVSPTHIELEVPGDGSATANLKVHYFSGDVKVSLIDIPLRVEPETVHVEASGEPVEVEITIYGDSALGSRIYDGYIRFIAVSGGAATGGVQVIAKITNVVEGEVPIPAEPSEGLIVLPEETELVAEEPVIEEPIIEEETEVTPAQPVAKESAAPTGPPKSLTTVDSFDWPIVPVVGIAGGAVVIILLVMLVRRRLRY